jgi:5-methylcytosine-specific restriction enzyme subunit McrC
VASAFLLDMNRVFEDFVVVALRDALGLDAIRMPQGKRAYLDAAGRVPMKPDLSWWTGRECRFVGDVKYKRTEVGEHADLYQLLAYVVTAGLDQGLLVYAAGEGEPVAHSVRHVGARLEVHTLGLSGPPEAILMEISRLAGHVRRLAEREGSLATVAA